MNDELFIHIYVSKIDYNENASKMGGVPATAVKCQFLGPERGKLTGRRKKIKRGLDKEADDEKDVKSGK
jgi:hypothetical protein